MNGATNAIIIGVIRSVLLAFFSILTAHGVMEKPSEATLEQIVGGVGSLVVIGFSIRAKLKLHQKLDAVQNGAATTPPASPPPNPNIGIKLMLVGLPLFLLSGCVTALKSDKIVSVKTRVFGISVGTSVVNQTPEVKLGFITSVYQMIPTAQSNTINAPRFFDTFKIGQGINPFTTEIMENTGSGDVAIYTNAQGSAVIPKAQIPAAPVAPGTSRSSFDAPVAPLSAHPK